LSRPEHGPPVDSAPFILRRISLAADYFNLDLGSDRAGENLNKTALAGV
jgi:hypothetical protein